MYVEVKTPASGRKYVYLKRSVRVGKKVKHITVERFGELQKLELMHPGFVDKLTQMCTEGSHQLFLRKLMAFERGIENTLHSPNDYIGKCAQEHGHCSHGGKSQASQDDAATAKQSADIADAASLLFSRPLTRLSVDEQVLVARSYCEGFDAEAFDEAVRCHVGFQNQDSDGDDGVVRVERESLFSEGFIDAVVVAAGVGKRMGSAVPKQYLKLDDKCILEHTVLKLLISPYVRRVIVVLSPEDEYFKFTCLGDLKNVVTVDGGKERVDSVLAGLRAVKSPWVMVHDAARPLISLFDIEKLLHEVALGLTAGFSGGLLVAKVADTLKEVAVGDNSRSDSSMLRVLKTADRSRMYRAQTPQFFKTKDLILAIEKALEVDAAAITDEASAMELAGHKVMLVEGSPLNFKVTEPADLLLVKALMSYCAPNI